MSDNINPFPIGLWSLAVGAQLATAIIDLWKTNLNRRRSLTGFEKILDGEKINGWQIAVSSDILRKKHGRCQWQWFVRPYWPVDEKENPHSSFSLLVDVIESMPDGRKSVSLCRYSLVATDLSSTIIQIVYDENECRFYASVYVTDRIVALLFRANQGEMFRFILIDTISKSYRRLTVASPIEGAFLYAICPGDISKRHINALFTKSHWSAGALRAEFYEVPYEIPISNRNTDVALLPRGCQSISIPNGESIDTWTHIGIGPEAVVLYDYDHPTNVNSVRVVTYDRDRNWRIESLENRLSTLRSTDYGAKLFNAVDSLDSLQFPDRYQHHPVPLLRNLTYTSEYHIGGSIFLATRDDGLLHRFLYPPTLKRMAAETFCRSKRRFNFGHLKQVIGFDIFDGILEEEEEKVVIYF